MTEPSVEEARGWIGMGTGKYFKNELVSQLEDLKDSWVNGDFTAESTEATTQLNSEALGKAQAIAEILLTLEEMTTDEEVED